MDNLSKEFQNRDQKDPNLLSEHPTSLPLGNTVITTTTASGIPSQYKLLFALDKSNPERGTQTASESRPTVKMMPVTSEFSHSEDNSEVHRQSGEKEEGIEKHSLKGAIIKRISNKIAASESCVGRSATTTTMTDDATNEITITKTYSDHKNNANNVNSLQRHIPFVSVTPYMPGSTLVAKPRKQNEVSPKNRKFAQINRINSADGGIKVEPEVVKGVDRTNCRKDEMMAAQILASKLGARMPDMGENGIYDDDCDTYSMNKSNS